MWKTFASTQPTPPAQRGSLKLFGLALAVSLALALAGLSSPANGGTRVSFSHPRIPGTMIACFHKKVGRFTAEVEPARCDIAGHEGEERKFVRFPIESITWRKWGRFRSLGSFGVEVRNQTRVRAIAFRRVKCADGRTWYSSANVVNLRNGDYFVVRLPTCNDPPAFG